jgi:hypothetical protein
MTRTTVRALLASGLVLTGLVAAGSPAAAVPRAQADYRFNNNLRSSVNQDDAPRLRKVGTGFSYGVQNTGNGTDNYLDWTEGSGLKLPNAQKVFGRSRGDYTIAMLVSMDEDTSQYRKLVDLDNRESDEGWYNKDNYLYPYDVVAVEDPAEPPLTDKVWHLIVMTRANGNVKGYVDHERYFTEADDDRQEVLGEDKILHFLIDDSSNEHGGGLIARLRIWKDPLTTGQAEDLKSIGE